MKEYNAFVTISTPIKISANSEEEAERFIKQHFQLKPADIYKIEFIKEEAAKATESAAE